MMNEIKLAGTKSKSTLQQHINLNLTKQPHWVHGLTGGYHPFERVQNGMKITILRHYKNLISHQYEPQAREDVKMMYGIEVANTSIPVYHDRHGRMEGHQYQIYKREYVNCRNQNSQTEAIIRPHTRTARLP